MYLMYYAERGNFSCLMKYGIYFFSFYLAIKGFFVSLMGIYVCERWYLFNQILKQH